MVVPAVLALWQRPQGNRHRCEMNGFVEEILVSRGWRDQLDALIGRRRDLVLIAGLVGAALCVSLVLWARGAPAAVAPPARAPSVPGAAPSGAPGAPHVYVHVAGAVRRPGLYELPPGARVADAIDAAGGPRVRADLDAVNLAEVVEDGGKIDVPARGEAAPAEVALSPAPAATTGGVIDINAADQAALETIPGVGPVTASAIVRHRDEVGGFDSVDELLDVTGIGPATLEAIRPYVTI